MNVYQAIDYIKNIKIDELPFKNGLTGISWAPKNGNGDFGILFKFKEKKPLELLNPEEIVPKYIEINNERVVTDVDQEDFSVPLINYCHSDPNFAPIPPLSFNQARSRPLSGGCESNPLWAQYVSTLGLFAIDKQDRQVVAVSNAHVYGRNVFHASRINSDNSQRNIIFPAITGYQPTGYYRTSQNNDAIGTTKRTIVIGDENYGGPNDGNQYINDTSADASILALSNYSLIDSNSNSIIGFNVKGPYTWASRNEVLSLADPASPNFNAPIFKSGRTTGPIGFPGNNYSCKTSAFAITTVGVNLGNNYIGYYNECIEFDGAGIWPVLGGDSGSAAFALLSSNIPSLSTWKFIGLVFAGPLQSQSTYWGYITPVHSLQDSLDLKSWDGKIPTHSSTTTVISSSITYSIWNNNNTSDISLWGRPTTPWVTSSYIILSGRKFTMCGQV